MVSKGTKPYKESYFWEKIVRTNFATISRGKNEYSGINIPEVKFNINGRRRTTVCVRYDD